MKNVTRNGRENDLPTESAKRSRLAERPERRGGRRASALLFVLCGCLIILGGGGVLAWQLSLRANAPAVSTSTPASSNSPAKQPASCTGAREPVDVIMQQTAQGLHLSVAQVQARVLAGKTVAQIATEQGLTAAQLHDVEVQVLRYANNRWKNLGCITQQDVQDNMQRDTGTAAYMDAEFTDWFRGLASKESRTQDLFLQLASGAYTGDNSHEYPIWRSKERSVCIACFDHYANCSGNCLYPIYWLLW